MKMHQHQATPQEIVAAVEATSEKWTTPCGSGEMVWHVWGRGDPVVFLHGGMGSWMHWIRNVPVLSREITMLIPDIPGHMDSVMPPEPYTPETIAAILVQGIDRIIPSTPYSVVGFSFGAAIGGHVARLGGDSARTLALVSPGGLGLPRGKNEPMQKWRHLESEEARRAAHRRNLQMAMISNPEHVDDLAVFIHSESTQRAKLVSAPISLGDTLQACLPQVKACLAGIWGAQDPASAPHMAERRDLFHRIQRNARMAIIDDASHWVQYEAPESFNETLLDVLLRTTAAERKG
jgi:2-hydroxy-6-oxonona-2,4-dienedioate hydrolase